MNSSSYFDTYFLDSQTALKSALQKNEVLSPNGIVSSLQICYYDGDKIDNAPINCINVPFDSIINYFSTTKNRLPTVIDSTNTNFSSQDISSLKYNFQKKMAKVNKIVNNKIKKLHEEISNLKPDFQDKTLRIFAHGCKETVLIKHFVKGIIDALKKFGYETHLHKQFSEIESCCEVFHLQALKNFNPHITININHLNNQYISSEVLNFIWFQDRLAVERINSSHQLRQRDYVFHLIKSLSDLLMSRGIQSTYQGFCINTDVYKNRESIERKDKIVMIGSSYKAEFDLIPNKRKNEIVKKLLKFYTSNEDITAESRRNYFNFLRKKYDIKTDVELGQIVNYVKRDGFLLLISKMNLDYELEIYGLGWETHPQLKTYFKGVLPYGEEISKVYNSAKYSLVLGGYVKQQRTLESAASGCIPLVYDSRYNLIGDEDNSCFQESLVFFKKPADIASLIKKNHNVDLNCIVEANSYQHFAQKFVDIIEREKGE